MRLADQYDGFLIDLDGVVWLGHDLIPGAAETLAGLIDEGKPIAFVTNSPRLAPAEHAEVLRAGGIPVENGQVVTSATTLIEMAHERLGPKPQVIATGTDSFLAQLEAGGIRLLGHEDWQKAEAVLISGHAGFDYAELKAAAMAARNGALLAATGRDPTMPMPDGLWPGTGSILAAIETASETKGFITGKPERRIFEAGLMAIGAGGGGTGNGGGSEAPPMRIAMIGDRADTDVAGAQSAGLDGILVTGGRSTAGRPDVTPDHVISDLSALMEPAG